MDAQYASSILRDLCCSKAKGRLLSGGSSKPQMQVRGRARSVHLVRGKRTVHPVVSERDVVNISLWTHGNSPDPSVVSI